MILQFFLYFCFGINLKSPTPTLRILLIRMAYIDRTIFEPLLEYAEHIVWQSPQFREFAIACIDHLGDKCIPLIKSAYGSLYFAPYATPKERMSKPTEYENVSTDEIYQWFRLFGIKLWYKQKVNLTKKNAKTFCQIYHFWEYSLMINLKLHELTVVI